MPTVEQLSRLFKAIARHDLAASEREAAAIAADEKRKGHITAAQLLSGALSKTGVQSVLDRTLPTGVDGQAALLTGALFQRTQPVHLSDVALTPGNRSALQELIREEKNERHLRARGIRRRSKLLFHGPPGCGKTMAAQALGHALELPVFVVRFDAVVGSYLGQTATHLRQLFQFAQSQKCILLFDEIDALGKRRGSPSDVGELDRIVIALMQELELSQVAGFVIATSNLAGSLDDALWRRFDLSLQFRSPTATQLRQFVTKKAAQYRLPASRTLLAKATRVPSYAEAEKAVEDAARRAVLRTL